MIEWERVAVDYEERERLYRVKVFEGWIVKTTKISQGNVLISTCFVPDKNHEWVIHD